MSDARRLSFKRVEISLIKFNDVAVPHHIDILRKHKDNILKFQSANNIEMVQKEQINATRVVKQLKQTLYEVETLRNQVLESDLAKFDKHTDKSINITKKAIAEYLEIIPSIKPYKKATSKILDNSEQTSHGLEQRLIGNIETVVVKEGYDEEQEIRNMEAYATSWEDLQNEVREIQELFVEFNSVVQHQQEDVNVVSNNIETTHENVREGYRSLAYAAKLKPAMYPMAGALIGTCLGGPIGLIAGLKVGGVAAMGCGILGFTGGRILHKKKQQVLEEEDKKLL